MDEEALIAGLRARGPDPPGMLGIGDDCCVWTPRGRTCLSTDAIVEGRHFLTGTPAPQVGRKAAAAAISDLAAMGAIPVGAVSALCCPAGWDAVQVMEGLAGELARHGCPLLGGDTTASDLLVITVTVWGEAGPSGRLLTRSGGRPGDLLAVTGPLGGSLSSGRHLHPEPRLAEGRFLASLSEVHAMMDLSDGLAADAPRLAQASGCGLLLEADRIPIHPEAIGDDLLRAACCDGEDYELLVALDPRQADRIVQEWPFASLRVVGSLQAADGCLLRRAGQVAPLPWKGFVHHW